MLCVFAAPPKIKQRVGGESGVAEGIAGYNVDIRCIATGEPQPRVEFYKVNVRTSRVTGWLESDINKPVNRPVNKKFDIIQNASS